MTSNSSAVPDLLRRFVPTPFAAMFVWKGRSLRVETNEFAIITQMHLAMASMEKEEIALANWKLIRDPEAPCDSKQLTVLSDGSLGAVLLGTGTVIAVDRERREVLGFLAPDVSAEEFVTRLLPVIQKLAQQHRLAGPPETMVLGK